jgi:hypothetical protein
MLVARVVTNGSNIATITNLANAATLVYESSAWGTDWFYAGFNGSSAKFSFTYNWGRHPTNKSFNILVAGSPVGPTAAKDVDKAMMDYALTQSALEAGGGAFALALSSMPATRYVSQFRYQYDIADTMRIGISLRA